VIPQVLDDTQPDLGILALELGLVDKCSFPGVCKAGNLDDFHILSLLFGGVSDVRFVLVLRI
jgi:hypothetical protein